MTLETSASADIPIFGRNSANPRPPAQGMIWPENVNKIKGKGGLCPLLCRDPLQL